MTAVRSCRLLSRALPWRRFEVITAKWSRWLANRSNSVRRAHYPGSHQGFDFVRSEPQLRDNTLILLCSDNGHEKGLGSGGDPMVGRPGEGGGSFGRLANGS